MLNHSVFPGVYLTGLSPDNIILWANFGSFMVNYICASVGPDHFTDFSMNEKLLKVFSKFTSNYVVKLQNR